jgi:hypothetical protein
MSKLSRRTLVASVASLPALAAPAVAGALPGDADTELKQLGVRFLQVHRTFDALHNDRTSADVDWRPHLDEQADLVPKILSQTAMTREGIAVQVVACISGCQEIWEEEGSNGALDTERPFIEAIARYAGVRHPVPNIKPWSPLDEFPEAKPDPIHGTIDDFRSALDAHDKLFDADDADDDPTLSDTFTLVSAELAKKRDALIDTVPRSAEGIAAVVAFVIGNEYLLLNFHEAGDPSEIVRFLTTVARAAFAQAGLPSRIPAPAAV